MCHCFVWGTINIQRDDQSKMKQHNKNESIDYKGFIFCMPIREIICVINDIITFMLIYIRFLKRSVTFKEEEKNTMNITPLDNK